MAYRPLTVAFHEAGFAERLNAEDAMGLPFAQDQRTRQQAGTPWGPVNPQALNRYSYVMGNPQKWTDPSGHDVRYREVAGFVIFSGGEVINDSTGYVYVTGERPLYNSDGTYRRDSDGKILFTQVKVLLAPGESSKDHGLVDADFIEPTVDYSIDGRTVTSGEYYKVADTSTVHVVDDGYDAQGKPKLSVRQYDPVRLWAIEKATGVKYGWVPNKGTPPCAVNDGRCP